MTELLIESNVRELTDHIVENKSSNLFVAAIDAPGQGGACHEYVISHLEPEDEQGMASATQFCQLSFQNGAIQEGFGVNGITHEALLAILIDRLRGFQRGHFACPENAFALTSLEISLMWLQKRTRDRIARGVEGTHKN